MAITALAIGVYEPHSLTTAPSDDKETAQVAVSAKGQFQALKADIAVNVTGVRFGPEAT